MKNFYEVGRVYVWQNLPPGWAHMVGQETTIIGDAVACVTQTGRRTVAQLTDTPKPFKNNHGPQTLGAERGQLRPKTSPPGEQSVLDMFKQAELTSA